MVLEEGDSAPDFDLPTDSGENVSLESFSKKKNVVVYFYPKDNTPGCTIEAKDFKDKGKEFEKLNTVILGVSKDSVKSHANFKKKLTLPFSLVSDESGDMIKSFGAWTQKNMFGKKYMGIERSTFLINKSGNVTKIWKKVKVKGHAAEVLEEVKKLEKK